MSVRDFACEFFDIALEKIEKEKCSTKELMELKNKIIHDRNSRLKLIYESMGESTSMSVPEERGKKNIVSKKDPIDDESGTPTMLEAVDENYEVRTFYFSSYSLILLSCIGLW